MNQSLRQGLSRLVNGFWALVITALLGGVTVVMWHVYEQERLNARFRAEGIPTTVQLRHADHHGRTVWDMFGNVVYAQFTYRGRAYETRLQPDSGWVSGGDRLNLLYHPPTDEFRQPHPVQERVRLRGVSRLIGWTVLRGFSREHQALGGLLLAVVALFFVGAGAIAQLTRFTGLQPVARFGLLAVLGMGAVYFTYDTFQYYQYIDRLRTQGQPITVGGVQVERHRPRYAEHSEDWYLYEATFPFRGQNRRIAIDEPDYDRVKTGDTSLAVRYSSAADDFIAADYAPGFGQLAGTLGMWLLFIIVLVAMFRPAT